MAEIKVLDGYDGQQRKGAVVEEELRRKSCGMMNDFFAETL